MPPLEFQEHFRSCTVHNMHFVLCYILRPHPFLHGWFLSRNTNYAKVLEVFESHSRHFHVLMQIQITAYFYNLGNFSLPKWFGNLWLLMVHFFCNLHWVYMASSDWRKKETQHWGTPEPLLICAYIHIRSVPTPSCLVGEGIELIPLTQELTPFQL